MSLKNCPDCGQSVSSLAQACPNCARPMSPIAIRPNIPAGVWAPPDHRPAPKSSGPARIIVNRSQVETRPRNQALPTAPFKVQTEATSKPLKAQLAIWTILFIIGAILAIFSGYQGGRNGQSAFTAGVILAAIAIPGLIATKIRIWWHHG